MSGFLTALHAELYVALRSNATRLIVVLPGLISAVQLLFMGFRSATEQARGALTGGGFGQTANIG